MTVLCVKCNAKLAIPDERFKPELKLKCPGCGLVFPVSKARIAGRGKRAATASESPTPRTAAPTSSPPARGRAAKSSSSRGQWRLCSTHTGTPSDMVCEECERGYCRECGKGPTPNIVICPTCDRPCTRVGEWEARIEKQRRRARPLRDEIETIARYPVSDLVTYLMLSVVVGLMGLMGPFSMWLLVAIRKSILMWYAFHCVSRVSNGELKLSTPEFRGVDDLWQPLKLSFAAGIAAYWPFIVLMFVGGGMLLASNAPIDVPVESIGVSTTKAAQFEDGPWDEGYTEPEPGLHIFGLAIGTLLLLAACWMYQVLVTPVALMVAATTRSFMATINPKVALSIIGTLGTTYGEVLLIFGLITGSQWLIGSALNQIPIVGSGLMGFIDAYVHLAVGCLLGLVVDKNAEALGFD